MNALRERIMCMGWYLRRVERGEAVLPFYRDVLKLPVMRGKEPTWFIWGGEIFVFELIGERPPRPARDTDPKSAPLMPVFRCHDLDGLLEELSHLHVRILGERRTPHGRDAFVLDTDRQIVMLRERAAASPHASDIEAARRRARGDTFVYDWRAMPARIQELGWIRRQVRSLSAVLPFYTEILGLREVGEEDGAIMLEAGDNFILELAEGGEPQTPPEKDRTEITNSFVFHVDDHARMTTLLKERGVPVVQEIFFNSAHLTYVVDPEGQLLGFEERFEPHGYKAWRTPFAEDLEVNRRWRSYRMDAARGAAMNYSRTTRME